jgi:hypothetical protein
MCSSMPEPREKVLGGFRPHHYDYDSQFDECISKPQEHVTSTVMDKLETKFRQRTWWLYFVIH